MSFMNRWSQRKRSQGEEPPAPTDETTPDATTEETDAAPTGAAALIPGYDPQRPLDEQLPDPDTLGAGDDFRAFLLPGVGDLLKRRALRRMFKVGNYNVRDGLNDYDDDYTTLKSLAPEAGERIRQWLRRDAEQAEPQAAPATPETAAETPDADEAPAGSPDDTDARAPADGETAAPADGDEKTPNDPVRHPSEST